jgi:hypothetical protein
MKPYLLFFLIFHLIPFSLPAQDNFRIKGLCIGAPAKDDVDEFVTIIDNELAPAGVNTLILRVDFGYRFQTHPELVDEDPLEDDDIKKLVEACKKNNIRLIPQINLLGHQSWATKAGKLLEVYPEFDETPGIRFPEKYKWPNPDGLYCKSYCPLHPDVHRIVFDLVDEITEVFEADAFHAGMDEVFYIAHKQCPRCNGMDPAGLFAGEVTKIHNHLMLKNRELWIWGDRLIDGKTTGMGEWEASMNNTYRAVDLIPKDVVICDWHYDNAHPTPVLFAAKGFDVVVCPWKKSEVAIEQAFMLRSFLKNASGVMKPHYAGMVHTYWSPARQFMDGISGKNEQAAADPSIKCFRDLAKVW